MASLKQQLTVLALTSMLFTLLFGVVLSMAVNLSLDQLDGQSDLIVPGDTANPITPE